MNGHPATDLRGLIQGAVRLDGGRDWPAGTRAHQIGDGVKKDKSYATASSGRLALPRHGPGLQRLQEALDSGISGVPAATAREAWARLLNTPTLIVDAGSDSSVASSDCSHRLILASVFRSADEALSDGEITRPRFAAKAELTFHVRSEGGRRSVTDAWLTAEWFDTTRELLTALDRDSAVRTKAPGSDNARIDVVFAPDRVHWANTSETDLAIERIVHLTGMRARTLFLSGDSYAATQARLRSEQPTHLLFVGSAGIAVVRSEFEDRKRGIAHVVDSEDASSLLELLREKIPRIAGIAPNLMLINAPSAPQPARPALPPIDAAACKHVGSRIYVLDRESDLWWTRDDAHHADVQFKTYELQNNTLVWRADHGADHKIAKGKHKGTGTLRVPLRAATSCGNPRSHLLS